jgi:hypothetical protein
MLLQETSRDICFYDYYWFYISAGGLLVPKGIIRPLISVSARTWFIMYFYQSKGCFYTQIGCMNKTILQQIIPSQIPDG